MIELSIERYSLLEEPLKKVENNHLFAPSVIERKVIGTVFVDNIENPKTFYVVHPYGMSLLFGDNGNKSFNNDYCMQNDYEPIWACKLTNTPSYKLAQKLGFVPARTLPYYRLAL